MEAYGRVFEQQGQYGRYQDRCCISGVLMSRVRVFQEGEGENQATEGASFCALLHGESVCAAHCPRATPGGLLPNRAVVV